MNATKRKPLWRQVFDTVERTVGVPLEEVANSYLFVDVMAVGIKTRRALAGTAARVVGGVVTPLLRTANIATRDDIQRMTGHLSALTTEVRALSSAPVPQQPASRATVAAMPSAFADVGRGGSEPAATAGTARSVPATPSSATASAGPDAASPNGRDSD